MEEVDKQKRQSMNPTIQSLYVRQPFKRYSGWRQPAHPQDHSFSDAPSWRPDLNFSARSKTSPIVHEALFANRNGSYCGVLLLKKDGPRIRNPYKSDKCFKISYRSLVRYWTMTALLQWLPPRFFLCFDMPGTAASR